MKLFFYDIVPENPIVQGKSMEDNIEKLALSPVTSDRKLAASSPLIDVATVNKLAHDPTLNVAYNAVNNPKCTVFRPFENDEYIPKCVICDVSHVKNIARCRKCNKDDIANPHYHRFNRDM